MTHPIFDTLPTEYHDRVLIDSHDNATITVEAGDTYTVPRITNADRRRMGLPDSRHPDRNRTYDPATQWYPV